MAATAESVRKPEHQTQRKHFIFTDEHEQLRESIRNFALKELAPHAEEWEQTTFPDSVFRRMGELGFLGLDKPEQYGGQGGDYYTSLVLAEEITNAQSGGLAMGVAVQTDMAMPPILAFGTEPVVFNVHSDGLKIAGRRVVESSDRPVIQSQQSDTAAVLTRTYVQTLASRFDPFKSVSYETRERFLYDVSKLRRVPQAPR